MLRLLLLLFLFKIVVVVDDVAVVRIGWWIYYYWGLDNMLSVAWLSRQYSNGLFQLVFSISRNVVEDLVFNSNRLLWMCDRRRRRLS